MSAARRLLAIRPGGLGDCILSFPAIEGLRSRAQYLEVWVPRPVAPLVRFADRVRAISGTGLDLFGLDGVDADPRLLETLRGFDAIVSWYGTNRDDFRAAASSLGVPIEFQASLPPPGSSIHTCDFFSTQVGGLAGAIPRVRLGGPIPDGRGPLKQKLCPASEQDPLQRRDRKGAGIAIHPFSGSSRKNWPLERFDAVAVELGLPVEWCATQEQSALLGSRTPLFVADDLWEVATWLAAARLYIGNDSGLTHLAAAAGTPVVALFGASDPRVWAPRGVERIELVEAVSMDAIDVEAVVAAAATALRCDRGPGGESGV